MLKHEAFFFLINDGGTGGKGEGGVILILCGLYGACTSHLHVHRLVCGVTAHLYMYTHAAVHVGLHLKSYLFSFVA